MGIYVPGIKLPKEGDCIIVYSDGEVWGDGKPIGKVGTAVELPPHGRLIDADALKNKHHWTDDFYETEYVEVEDIDAAPTIIPAEGGDAG